ncbi:MAG: hypothetical protein IJH12_06945 [Clostridia bacterium]|nr:hypothetical protein [Clostridia bacterium]
MQVKKTKRRARRKYYNWEEEIAKGNTDKFYHSTDFKIWREKVLIRDKRNMPILCRKLERWKTLSR